MTKKHFKQVADAISRIGKNGSLDKQEMIDILACVFRDINPRFDYQRFNDACNGLPYKK